MEHLTRAVMVVGLAGLNLTLDISLCMDDGGHTNRGSELLASEVQREHAAQIKRMKETECTQQFSFFQRKISERLYKAKKIESAIRSGKIRLVHIVMYAILI